MVWAGGTTIIIGDSTFTPLSGGKYFVQVKNAVAAGLTLASETFTYTIPQQNRVASTAINSGTHFSIYPNPASNTIHIQTNGTAIIVLTNSTGKVLLTKNIKNNGKINGSALANGIFYIQNKTTGESKKIVVVH